LRLTLFLTLFRTHNPPLQSHQITGDAGGLGVGFLYDLQFTNSVFSISTHRILCGFNAVGSLERQTPGPPRLILENKLTKVF
jgi:hypothetical protein